MSSSDVHAGALGGRAPDAASDAGSDLRFVVAPMMGVTHHAFRRFLRILSRRTCLVTEMIVARAILERGAERELGHDRGQSPLLLQLGTADPDEARRAAEAALAVVPYEGINLNAGCPSPRVQRGEFGACLMAQPERLAAIVRALVSTGRSVSVKCRLGLDHDPGEESLDRLVDLLAQAGASAVIVHARNAWLRGLDPRRNRTVPPLRWERVFRLKERFPELLLVLNGGIHDLATGRELLARVDGVMLGRAIEADPMLVAGVDPLFYGLAPPVRDEEEALRLYLEAVPGLLAQEVSPTLLLDPLLHLAHGRAGARAWRTRVTEVARSLRSWERNLPLPLVTEALAGLRESFPPGSKALTIRRGRPLPSSAAARLGESLLEPRAQSQ